MHIILWNCQNTDANGDNLCETMDNAGMICLNQETESRLGNIGQFSSNINLIVGSPRMADIADVIQGEDTWGSDHFPIELTFKVKIQRYRKRTNRISTKKTRWKEYPNEILKNMKKKRRNKDYRTEDEGCWTEVPRIYRNNKRSCGRGNREKEKEKKQRKRNG